MFIKGLFPIHMCYCYQKKIPCPLCGKVLPGLINFDVLHRAFLERRNQLKYIKSISPYVKVSRCQKGVIGNNDL